MWQTPEKCKPTSTVHWVPSVLISSCKRQGPLSCTNDRQFTGRSNHSSPISGWEYWTRRGSGKASGLQWPCNRAILRSSVTDSKNHRVVFPWTVEALPSVAVQGNLDTSSLKCLTWKWGVSHALADFPRKDPQVWKCVWKDAHGEFITPSSTWKQ